MKRNHSTTSKLVAGVSVAILAFALSGSLPEVYRYLKIRRM
ncbi:MAG: hypothetical protein JWO36_7357 [Myxococcales bacterium]|nr:hypothetical protein [Myxococcales bacterium]